MKTRAQSHPPPHAGEPRQKDTPTVRDREATIQAILEAAEVVFARHGLRGARTDDIAATAGVVRGLIFYYFETKENLYTAVLERAYKPLSSLFHKTLTSTESPKELLEELVRGVLQLMNERPLAPSIVILEALEGQGERYRNLCVPSFYETAEKVLVKGMKKGCFRKLDAKHAAINIMGLCAYYFSALHNYTDPSTGMNPFSKKELTRHTKEVLAFVEARTTPELS